MTNDKTRRENPVPAWRTGKAEQLIPVVFFTGTFKVNFI